MLSRRAARSRADPSGLPPRIHRTGRTMQFNARTTPQTIEALAFVISGGSANDTTPMVGLYRSGPRLERIMRPCNVDLQVGSSSRLRCSSRDWFQGMSMVHLRAESLEIWPLARRVGPTNEPDDAALDVAIAGR